LKALGWSASVSVVCISAYIMSLTPCTSVAYSGFGGLEDACWPLVPKFVGSNSAEAVEFFRAKKISSMTSFGGEVKLAVPCRRFAACKRSLNVT
jgi:hypothetical protein